jgi:dTMP kinase
MFITFEGLDLSGKSTQARLLVAALEERSLPGEQTIRPVRFIREPGGTRISERLREILLDRKNLELHQTTELMLFSASRAQLVAEVIRPALLRGETVICDRYYDSTTAYQGYGRGLDLQAIRHINAIASGGVAPDLTLFIDVEIDEIGRRRRLAGLPADRMESAGEEFYRNVRRGYCDLVEQEPDRVVRVDGMEPIQKVEQAVWRILEATVSHNRMKS